MSYNYETIDRANTCGDLTVQDVGTNRCYTVQVEVRDGLNTDRVEEMMEAVVADDSITVKIGVRDRDEPPAVPIVMVTSPERDTSDSENELTKLIVTWHADNTGPPITDYDLQYREAGGSFVDDNCLDDLDDTEPPGNCNDISHTDDHQHHDHRVGR